MSTLKRIKPLLSKCSIFGFEWNLRQNYFHAFGVQTAVEMFNTTFVVIGYEDDSEKIIVQMAS